MMEVSGKHLQSMQNVERRLQAEEVKKLVNLPPGHPLAELVAKYGQELGGDLAGLPPGHPLIREIIEKKRQFEQQDVNGNVIENDNNDIGIRRAKKIDDKNLLLQKKQEEEESKQHNIGISRKANGELEKMRKEINDLITLLDSLHSDSTDDYVRNQILRLKRMMIAFNRGLNDNRVNITRIL